MNLECLFVDLSYLQFCRWFEGLIDFWAESQAKWSPRDYTEILISNVLASNTDFGYHEGTIDTVRLFYFIIHLSLFELRDIIQLVELVFCNRSSLRVLDVELHPYLDLINMDRTKAYKEAHDHTKDLTVHSDANPITRNHTPLPWQTAYAHLERAVRPLLGTPSPAVPLSVWQNHDLFKKHWAHNFINSNYPYRDIKSNDFALVAPKILTGFIFEYYLVAEYRKKLLKGPGGELRHIMLEVLPADMTEAITVRPEKSTTDYMIFWDAFYFPRVARESDEVYVRRGIIDKLDKSLNADIARIVKAIAKADVSKLHSGRYNSSDPLYVSREVEDATKVLVGVGFAFLYDYYFGILFTYFSTGHASQQS